MKERSKSHANINKYKHKQNLIVEPYLHFPINKTIQKYIESKQIELKEHNNKQNTQLKKEREFNLTMKTNKTHNDKNILPCYYTPMNKQHNELLQLKEDNVKLKEMLNTYKHQYEQLYQTFNSLKKEIDLFSLSTQLKVKQKPNEAFECMKKCTCRRNGKHLQTRRNHNKDSLSFAGIFNNP